MQRMWRRLFAAVLGVAAIAGAASAQSPPPPPLPPIIAVAAPVASPAGSSAIAIPQVMPAGGGPAIRTEGVGGLLHQPAMSFGHYGNGCGNDCNNGCGSVKHDLGFMFGSCQSFFDKCGPQPCEGTGRFRGKGGHGGRANCPDLPWGTPYGAGHNGCKYDSWLNH